MTTPMHERKPAKMDVLKKAKQLELYTIKKVCNEKYFSKKKYRRFLTRDIVDMAKECYTLLVKAYYSETAEKSYQYYAESLLTVRALFAQLEVANSLYSKSIPNIEYWSRLVLDVKEGIVECLKADMKKL